MAAYNFLDQPIVASQIIQPHDNDSFYNPGPPNSHFGFAADGFFYINGIKQANRPQASWFLESPNAYRGDGSGFPTAGLILLSPVALTILDQSQPTLDAHALPVWLQAILADTYALANNFDGALNGWTPTGLAYADGIISIIYTPDAGNQTGGTPPSANSTMIVTFDFSQDMVYLDVAI